MKRTRGGRDVAGALVGQDLKGPSRAPGQDPDNPLLAVSLRSTKVKRRRPGLARDDQGTGQPRLYSTAITDAGVAPERSCRNAELSLPARGYATLRCPPDRMPSTHAVGRCHTDFRPTSNDSGRQAQRPAVLEASGSCQVYDQLDLTDEQKDRVTRVAEP